MPRPPAKQAKPPRRSPAKRGRGAAIGSIEPTQRERLLSAMARVAEREGYAGTSIANVIAQAGVSRVTFYDEFADKETCFLASYDSLALRLLAKVHGVADGQMHRAQLRTALAKLLETLETEPEAGWGMLFEPTGGGPALRRQSRRRLLAASSALERFLADGAPDELRLRVPALGLLGGIRHVVARRIRRVEYDILPTLTDDLLTWMQTYAVRADKTARAGLLNEESFLRSELMRPPSRGRSRASSVSAQNGASHAAAAQRLPRGRRTQRDSVVNRQLRERLLGATTQMSMLKGYDEMTVADIVAYAGVGRGVFYANFRDKQDAFLAAQQHNLEGHISACSTSFFAASSWPERIWNGLRAVTEIIAADPALAHLWLVESFAAGPAAIHNAEELRAISTLYLQEGYHLRAEAAVLPRLCSEAIVGAIYEVLYQAIDDGLSARVGELLPVLAYLAIAPFAGAREAADLIEGYMSV